MLKSYLGAPVNMILFGNRVFTNDQVKMRSLGWTLTQCKTGVLIKRGTLDTKTDTYK